MLRQGGGDLDEGKNSSQLSALNRFLKSCFIFVRASNDQSSKIFCYTIFSLRFEFDKYVFSSTFVCTRMESAVSSMKNFRLSHHTTSLLL